MKITLHTSMLLVALTLLLSACSDDTKTQWMNLNEAWTAFEAEQYDLAASEFLSAVDQNNQHAEAWCGLGWSRAMLEAEEGLDYREAVLDAFHQADALAPSYVDAFAGLALYHSASVDTLQALEWSLDVLSTGGLHWQFAHRSDVNSRAMHKIAAWNLFKLQRYTECLTQVQFVFPSFQPLVESEDFLDLLFAQMGQI
jgi:hypothetical protein